MHMRKSSESKGLSLGKLRSLTQFDAWYPGVGVDARGLCLWAVMQGAPENVPKSLSALDHKFTLRELIEGAAVIAQEAQKVFVDLTIEGRPADVPIPPRSRKKDREALNRITAAVKGLPDEPDGRGSAARAAALLAFLFSLDVFSESGVSQNWQDFSRDIVEWQDRVRDSNSG